MQSISGTGSAFTRRGFLGAAAAAASIPLLAACSSGASPRSSKGAGGNTTPIAFWDMAWGAPAYSIAGKNLTHSYVPKAGLGAATYQAVQWANSYQTFAAAIASKTGPAIATGGSFTPFQFADQGAIAYADGVVSALKKNGDYDDFLPGTIDSFKTPNGYAAMPLNVDTRVLWYSKSLLQKAGVEPPTDWDSFITVGKALKKIGVSGFGTGGGAGNAIGKQGILSLLINNGGGFFDPEGTLDCVTERNIETLEFLMELSKQGIMSPASATYTQADLSSAWTSGKVGMGFHVPDLNAALGVKGNDFTIMSPVKGPHGDTGTLTFVNNIAMFKETPSQESSEAFLLWYLDHLKTYWVNGLVQVLPVRKSIADTPQFKRNANLVKAVTEWQPIAKPFATLSTRSFGALAAMNSGQPFVSFAQQVILGNTDPKTALTTLQQGMKQAM